ncbi:uncharacterized protein [Typha angustifolia]|uniref:uncharacterized protein isoform X1 n=1 Tax=Typha angustifolia TaxID=59011 RepID=UPI003C2CE3FA
MAWGAIEWGRRANSCSYRRITVVFCCVNIVVFLFVLRSLNSSVYFSGNPSSDGEYTEEQIGMIEESIRIRKAAEPVELVKVVRRLRNELANEEKSKWELPLPVKQKVAYELTGRLNSLKDSENVTEQRAEAVELWRLEKLKDIERAFSKDPSSSTTPAIEAKILKRALGSNWLMLMEDIGLWIVANVTNSEHDDKPDNELDEEEIIAGPPLPPECHVELHTDYGGTAVKWGLTHHKESAADCCQACLDQAKRAKPGEMKCNIWVYCPSEAGCHSPDIYEHKHQECWLKQAEIPKVTFKDKYSESYRNSHPRAPVIVPWMSGVIRK